MESSSPSYLFQQTSQYSVLQECVTTVFPALEKNQMLREEEGKLVLTSTGDSRAISWKNVPKKLAKIIESKKSIYISNDLFKAFNTSWAKLKKAKKIKQDGLIVTSLEHINGKAFKSFQTLYMQEITRIIDKKNSLTVEEIEKLKICAQGLYFQRKKFIQILWTEKITEQIEKIRTTIPDVHYFYDNEENQRIVCKLSKLQDPIAFSFYLYFLTFSTYENSDKKPIVVDQLKNFFSNKKILRRMLRLYTKLQMESDKKGIYTLLNMMAIHDLCALFDKQTGEKFPEKVEQLIHDKDVGSLFFSCVAENLETLKPVTYRPVCQEKDVSYKANLKASSLEMQYQEKIELLNQLYTTIHDRLQQEKQNTNLPAPENYAQLAKKPTAEDVKKEAPRYARIMEFLSSSHTFEPEGEDFIKNTRTKLSFKDWQPCFRLEERVLKKFQDEKDCDLRHQPAMALLPFFRDYGFWYLRDDEERCKKQPAVALWLKVEGISQPCFYRATMTFDPKNNPLSEKITGYDASWSCYHYFLTLKQQEEVVEEYVQDVHHKLVDFPALPSQKFELSLPEEYFNTIYPDGSYVEKVDGQVVIVRSPQYDEQGKECRIYVYVTVPNQK